MKKFSGDLFFFCFLLNFLTHCDTIPISDFVIKFLTDRFNHNMFGRRDSWDLKLKMKLKMSYKLK